MAAQKFGSFAALLGGGGWLVAAVLGWGAEPDQGLYLAGLALMLLALSATGYALVARAPIWLRVVVALATPALGLMVWLSIFDAVSAEHLALLAGGIALLLAAGVGLSRGRHGQVETEGRGTHAAR